MLTLFAQYFVPKKMGRRSEIDECFLNNIKNPLVEKFVVFFEKESDMELLPNHPKMVRKLMPERISYGTWLQETNLLEPGSLSVLVNADIYLDHSIQYLIEHASHLEQSNKFVALSRYNPIDGELRLNENPHWTQDAWAVVRPKTPFSKGLIQEASFELGQPGCDNKIVYIMHSYGFSVINPCEHVRTIHLQASADRNYDSRHEKLLGLHAFAHPTSSISINSKLDFDLLTRNPDGIRSVRVNNWINQTKDYVLETISPLQVGEQSGLLSQNQVSTTVMNKLSLADVEYQFQQKDGYDFIDIRGFNAADYLLLYYFDSQYQVYRDEKFYYFVDKYWPTVKRILKTQETVFYSKNDLFIVGFLPAILELDLIELGREPLFDGDPLYWQSIDSIEEGAYKLHQMLRGPQISQSFVDIYIGLPWATVISLNGSDIKSSTRALSVISATLNIRIQSAKAHCEKFGYQLRVNTVCQDIKWKELLTYFRKIGITDLWLADHQKSIDKVKDISLHLWGPPNIDGLNAESSQGLGGNSYSAVLSKLLTRSQDNPKLKIFMPYYGPEDRYHWRREHRGFAKIVLEWERLGLCEIEHHRGPYYWINKIGTILFFDRDQVIDLMDGRWVNTRWVGEVPYQHAFFVNEYNLENDRNHRFQYFPMDAVQLEASSSNRTLLGYRDRNIDSIFIGSIENETQEYFRNKFSEWPKVIDEYYLADKLNKGEGHKYKHDEYLDLIASAKFGISFRGNGPKCFREIEYASLGTPMIITEGVEMNYPDPLIEGVHYFFAQTPDDIKRIISETSESKWQLMSRACQDWYQKNCTIQSMFINLKAAVERLDLNLEKPKTVFISPVDHDLYQMTCDSLRIFNPGIEIVDTIEKNTSSISINSGDVVINELPYQGGIDHYVYAVPLNMMESYKDQILKSNLSKNKRLATLLRWRLRNYLVSLKKNGKDIDSSKYIGADGVLRIDDPEVHYLLEINYSLDRATSSKYHERQISGVGHLIYPKLVIQKAILFGKLNKLIHSIDITEKYAEYVAYHDCLVPEDQVWREFKFWMVSEQDIVDLHLYIECHEDGIFKVIDHKLVWLE